MNWIKQKEGREEVNIWYINLITDLNYQPFIYIPLFIVSKLKIVTKIPVVELLNRKKTIAESFISKDERSKEKKLKNKDKEIFKRMTTTTFFNYLNSMQIARIRRNNRNLPVSKSLDFERNSKK